MIALQPNQYAKILEDPSWVPNKFLFDDHIGGFDVDLQNSLFTRLNDYAQVYNKRYEIYVHQIFTTDVKVKYPNLKIKFSVNDQERVNTGHFYNYNIHPAIDYKNFICSFNGSIQTGRKLLVSIINKFGYFDPAYCSKNFVYSTDILDGHIIDYVGDQDSFYRKFFILNNSEDFFQTKYSFGHVRFDHNNNIYTLENKITQSFLHVVSETFSTSYYPFVTEKFLYSIITRGLFLSYAQPGWHAHVEKYYGFKKYTKLFNYNFDLIQNPVERLVELVTMISKFKKLTTDDWKDLYQLEQDTIEYNYNHYFSGNYLYCLKEFA